MNAKKRNLIYIQRNVILKRQIKPYSEYMVTVFSKSRTASCKNSHGLDLPPGFYPGTNIL